MKPAATILIVDDNLTNLLLAMHVLKSEGYTVACAQNAAEAQEKMKEARPDLILMDIQLPGVDGLELTRRLKADAEYKHIPVIAITALVMQIDEQQARDAGCAAFVIKPIDTRKLPVLVAEILQLHPAPKADQS